MIKKYHSVFLLSLLLFACKEDGKLPKGFEDVSKDGNSHFVYVGPENLGDKMEQRKAGRIVCENIYHQEEYCEVYFFDDKKAIPVKFPMVNRIRPLGKFTIKNGITKFKVLTENDYENNSN